MKLDLELTPAEMIALGYAIGAGAEKATKQHNARILKDLAVLMSKVYIANEKAEDPEQ